MKLPCSQHTISGRLTIRSLVLGMIAILVGIPAAFAAETAEQLPGSLKFVPANVSGYSSSVRLREQWEAVLKSKAWKKLVDLPLTQKAWKAMQANAEFADGLDKINEFFGAAENQELLALVKEMVSDEIFSYGDENWPQLFSLMMQAQAAANYAPMFALMRGEHRSEAAQFRAMMDTLDANRDKLRIPCMVAGFKIKDAKRAVGQLERLEVVAAAAAGMTPELQGRIFSKKVGDAKFVTLNLDGGMIPWDEIPFDRFAENQGQYDKLIEKLKSLKLVVGIGLRGDYIIVTLGDSLDHLAKLGEGSKLADRPELKKLTEFAGKKIAAVGYLSKDFRNALENNRAPLVYLRRELTKVVAEGDLPDDAKKRIQKDLNDFNTDAEKQFYSQPGPQLLVTTLTGRGYEGYSYDWSEHPLKDGSKPLTLLDHLGGTPIAFVAFRHKPAPDSYDTLVKWLKVGFGYGEEFALPLLGNDEREKYDKFMKQFLPLVRRIDKTTRAKLFPALADGQSGFVLDAKIFSKQWHRDMMPTKQALPMLEPAIVWGVSNGELLKTAMGEYREAINDFFSSFNLDENPLALMRILEPDSKPLAEGTMFYYSILDLAGFDSQIVPNGGVSKDTAIVGISSKQTERVLASKPLAIPDCLANAKRPLAGAAHFDCAAFIDAIEPWIMHGVRSGSQIPGFLDVFGIVADDNAIPKIKADVQDPPEVKAVVDQVHTILEVFKCFNSYSSVTYPESGVWVTHSITTVKDIP